MQYQEKLKMATIRSKRLYWAMEKMTCLAVRYKKEFTQDFKDALKN